MSLVQCPSGNFEGIFKDNCHQFFGIPFAKFNQRWEESRPIEKEISLTALEKGNSSPQTRFRDENHSGVGFFLDTSLTKESEDCLSLNICTEDIGGTKPVMIWIH